MSERHRCPRCQAIVSDAAEGLCPRCLTQPGLEVGALTRSQSGEAGVTITRAPSAPPGALETLSAVIGTVPRIMLRDTTPDGAASTSVGPVPDVDPTLRYRIDGEIGRGGMGSVLKGRDPDLGRDVAIKVLREDLHDNGDMVRRFVEEAQIGGQLQHPGVVPIYELGTFADHRPFFSMKLVRGQTLAALLKDRSDSNRDLPRFLSIYAAIAQTMAYAHTRGVIHRDLKPSNVMVGSFGEVQVMDWGLAKVLAGGGFALDAKAGNDSPREAPIATARSEAGTDQSHAGSVMGTPAYMAPEQARGETDRLDERCDVFALGSILCDILTGAPAFTGGSAVAIVHKAANAETGDALARLGDCGAEAELIALAKDCLAAEPEDRPRDANVVTERITAYLAGVQGRLRQTELARVEATARAEEERKRRKLTLALAASIVGTILLGGSGWYWNQRQRQERAARADLALREAEVLRDQAEQAGDDVTRWTAAQDAAHAVERLLADARDERTRHRVTNLVEAVDAAATAALNDRKLLDKLIDIRSAKEDDRDGSATDAAYARAFRDVGIDVVALPPADAGAKIRARPQAVAVTLSAALDDWAAVRRDRRRDRAGAARLAQAARAADPDPWRNGLRDALESFQPQQRLDALHVLVGSARFEELPPIDLHLLGVAVRDAGDAQTAERVLREAQHRHAGDLWLNYDLALCLERLARRDEAIRYYTAARAIRPETAHVLAHALQAKGEVDEAIAVFQDLVRFRPDHGHHLVCLGAALRARGRNPEATVALDAGIAALRADLRRRPDDESAHGNLGVALREQGKLDEAITSFRNAIRLKTGFAQAHYNLALSLHDQGKVPEAIAEYREAIRYGPDDPLAHGRLGLALASEGKLDEAIVSFREAIRLRPNLAFARTNLGEALLRQGKPDEAIAEHRKVVALKPDEAEPHMILGAILCDHKHDHDGAVAEFQEVIRLRPDYAEAYANLAIARIGQAKLAEAIAAYREAIRIKPDFAEARFNLAEVLRDHGEIPEAIAAYREVIRLKPDYAEAHCNLGLLLREQGRYIEALPALRRGNELGSKRPGWPYPSEEWVRDCERLAPLEAKLPEILKGKAQPADAGERITIAQILYRKQWYAATVQHCAEAFQADARLAADVRAGHRYHAACAAALAGCGKGKDDPPPSAKAKARIRQQALDWLKAELVAWTRALDSGPPQAGPLILQTLPQWKQAPDLAGIRDADALAKLPADEQPAWQSLWAEVESLLKRAQGKAP